jgi:hypothetical protein
VPHDDSVNDRKSVGRYKLNPVDPQLETTRFQPLRLSSEDLVSIQAFAFKCNLHRYAWGAKLDAGSKRTAALWASAYPGSTWAVEGGMWRGDPPDWYWTAQWWGLYKLNPVDP